MRDILDRVFPESEPTDDPLGGLPDCYNGNAKRFFAALDTETRDLTQWYLLQGIGPYQVYDYLFGLTAGYHAQDPQRRFTDAMSSAQDELLRLRSYTEVFINSVGYFPMPQIFNQSVRDEEGQDIGSFDFLGWGTFSNYSGAYSLESAQEHLSALLETIDEHCEFLQEPSSRPVLARNIEVINRPKA